MPFSEAEIIADPGYPGWHSGMAVGPRMHTVARPIGPELKDSFWILEYRWSYGIRPLGFTVVDDAMNWGLQRGAYETHLPGSNGQDYALAGVHAYCRELPQFSALEDEAVSSGLMPAYRRFWRVFRQIGLQPPEHSMRGAAPFVNATSADLAQESCWSIWRMRGFTCAGFGRFTFSGCTRCL